MSKKKIQKYNRANLKMRVIITKSNGEVCERLSRFKLRILSFAKANYDEGDKIQFKITYKPGIENKGEYHDWKEFLKAYISFTEEDLIKDVLTY